MAYLPSFEPVKQWQRGQAARAYAIQDQLDTRISGTVQYDMTSGSVDATEDDIKRYFHHEIINCTAAGRILTLPDGGGTMQGPMMISSDGSNTQSCQIVKGEALFVIAPGETRSFWNEPDGDTIIEIAGAGGGSITVPTSKVPTFSGARVRSSTTHAETQSTFSKLSWNTEIFDVGGWHASSPNERMTVPSGVTRVKMTVGLHSNTNADQNGNIVCVILKNGSEIVFKQVDKFADNNEHSSTIVTNELNVEEGDYFEVYVCFWENTNTLALTGAIETFFCIWATAVSPYASQPGRDIKSNYVAGTPGSNAVVYVEQIDAAVSLFDDFAGSYAHCGTNPSGATSFDVQVDGASIGSVSFDTGGNPTFSTTGSGVETIAAGSYFSIVAPGTLNGIADLAFTFRGAHA